METHSPSGCNRTEDTTSNNYFSWGFGRRNALFYSKALVSVASSPAITQLRSAAPFWSALGCGVLPPSGQSLMLELILGQHSGWRLEAFTWNKMLLSLQAQSTYGFKKRTTFYLSSTYASIYVLIDLSIYHVCMYVCMYVTGSHYIDQASLKLRDHLPLPAEFCD